QKRTFFYRISPKGVTMLPSAQTGAITLTFSSPILVAGHVGTIMRFVGRQIRIDSLVSSTVANATVIEPLPGQETLAFATNPGAVFNTGDEVQGLISGAKGIITSVNPPGNNMSVQLLTTGTTPVPFGVTAFAIGETIVGT